MQKYPKMMTLRLDDKIWSDLHELANEEESSMTDIVRELIKERIDEGPRIIVV